MKVKKWKDKKIGKNKTINETKKEKCIIDNKNINDDKWKGIKNGNISKIQSWNRGGWWLLIKNFSF